MGFFNRKKKSIPSLVVASPTLPDALPIPTVDAPPPTISSYLKLRVLVDRSQHESDADPTFHIHADPDAPVSSIKLLVEAKLGDNVNAGCYKVAIPFAAVSQARQYTKRFNKVVNFISVFPAANLHDPEQLQTFCGVACRSSEQRELLVRDWFPMGVDNSEGLISILVRTVRGSSSSLPPLTLLAHLAPSPSSCALNPRASPDVSSTRSSSSRRTPHCRDNHVGSIQTRQLPIPIDAYHNASVGELKRATLTAIGADSSADLEKIVVWQVDMTPEEMVVIEERGGLKHGQMPWPYPPTALVPINLSEKDQPLSQFFTQPISNTRNVSLSIWLHPSIFAHKPTDTETPPPFAFPMNFDALDVVLSRTPSTASSSSRSRSGRPSTAPAAIAGSVPAFGSRPKPTRTAAAYRARPSHSPLSLTSHSAGDAVGLGIAFSTTSSASSFTATDSSDSEPASSRSSSHDGLEPGLRTPRDELPSMLLTAQRGIKAEYQAEYFPLHEIA